MRTNREFPLVISSRAFVCPKDQAWHRRLARTLKVEHEGIRSKLRKMNHGQRREMGVLLAPVERLRRYSQRFFFHSPHDPQDHHVGLFPFLFLLSSPRYPDINPSYPGSPLVRIVPEEFRGD